MKDKPSTEPDILNLKKEYDRANKQYFNQYTRERQNWEARYNIWPGQSPDGKKHREYLSREPFPFEGASDARVPLIDTYVNEDVDMLMVAFWGSKLNAFPVESSDPQHSNRVSNFMRWLIFNQMDETDYEAELAANYMCEDGQAIIGVFWEQEQQLVYETMTMDNIRQWVQQLPPGHQLADLPDMIMNPDLADQVVDLGEQLLPDQDRRSLRRIVKDLREEGTATYTKPVTVKNRPTIVALREGQDFFAPPGTTEIQKARMLFYREYVSESELRDRIQAMGYDEEWVEQVLEHTKGQTTYTTRIEENRTHNLQDYGELSLDTSELYEILHAYERRNDEEGVPGIFVTVMSAFYTHDEGGDQAFGKDELLGYLHGEYPFVELSKERRNRRFADARGHGEIGYTWQQQIKAQWDSRIDRESMATLPPLMHPTGRAPTKWGPGVRVPYMRSGEYHYADAPNRDRGSEEVEASVRMTADRYFGRPIEGQDMLYARNRLKRLIDRWLHGWRKVFTQVFQLCQQFMPDEFYFRVVGSAKAQPIKASRQEIQGQFDITISYNTLNMDPENLKAILDMIMSVVEKLDVNGITDRNELLTVAFEFLDPNIGERVLKPAENATQQEIEDEQTAFTKILAGLDSDVREGQAHQLRLQVLEAAVQDNPVAQERLNGSKPDDERVRELFEKRVKQHQFQLQQRQNALIGRLGA